MSNSDILQRAARKVDGYLQGLAKGSELMKQKRESSEEKLELPENFKITDLLEELTPKDRECAISYLLGLADATKEAKEEKQ